MLLAGRLDVPEGAAALLFDLDGVLLDSLSVDYEIVGTLLQEEHGSVVEVPRSVIRENFPHAIPDFWRGVSDACALGLTPEVISRLAEKHESRRRVTAMTTHNGIPEIIAAARSQSIPIGVVSNNPHGEISRILAGAGLVADVIVGDDEPGLRRKPAPDTYQKAANRLSLRPAACMAVEDSLLGAEAAGVAGCYTVAVATGANSFRELSGSPYVSRCYTSFARCHVSLGRAGVMSKTLSSPNEFVSHMIEHIAWRLGCSIDLSWTNDDWRGLGSALGREVRKLPIRREAASTIGMIDDGSAEIRVTAASPGGAVLTASRQVDLEWFLSSRAEQLSDGKPLVEVLEGLGAGGALDLDITVASFEDPHHTWEGVFRGVGIALDKMFNEQPSSPSPPRDEGTEPPAGPQPTIAQQARERAVERGWTVRRMSEWGAGLERRTAESVVGVSIRLGAPSVRCTINVADSIDVTGMADLLAEFAEGAALQLDVTYEAVRLSSSHVVTEDIGTTLGRALRYMAIERMDKFGIQGAGSSIRDPSEGADQPIRVGVSMEGRKFWKYVPMSQDYGSFRKTFLVGHTLANGLYSEDLDDFVDGLAGGLESSIIMHIDDDTDPAIGWPMLFRGLGEAMAGLLAVNPHRLSLAPGVKATLA
ncbi:MAG: HAD family phosphatase [Pseudonocardiales bacterium]|nr:HAD family phosphatase [Pseudonocardiales bacterium]MBV9029135.1 HAD family phosphatase [Pseudonocardiales bacterium]